MTVAVISRILAAARSNAVSGSLMVKRSEASCDGMPFFCIKILIKSFFQDKIVVSIHSDGGDFLNIRLLTPEDAQEYAKLRLEALRLNPESFAMSYEEEKLDTKNKYKARFACLYTIYVDIRCFSSRSAGRLGDTHTRNLAEIKAPCQCGSDVCNDRWTRKRNGEGTSDKSTFFCTRKKRHRTNIFNSGHNKRPSQTSLQVCWI